MIAVGVLFSALLAGADADPELEGGFSVRAGTVTVRLTRADVPAAEVPVRVVDQAGTEVVAGKTDTRGTWTAEVTQPGDYEAVVGANLMRMPFRVGGPPAEATAPVGLRSCCKAALKNRTRPESRTGLAALLGAGGVAFLSLGVVLLFARRMPSESH